MSAESKHRILVVANETLERAAEERLRPSLARLTRAGMDAKGWVGDADPLQALDDGVRLFQPDEIVIAARPPPRSHWLERDLVELASARFARPVVQLAA